MSGNAVTYHPVIRHSERVHGFETTERFPFAPDRYRAEVICDRFGLTIDEARD